MGSLRPGLLFELEAFVGAVASLPGETRFKGEMLRGRVESADPIISAIASHTLEYMFYDLLAPQMTTEAEVLLMDAVASPLGSQEKGLA